jgi:hypothetical protein
MALFKDLKELQEELQYWKEYEPVNNMGKWYISIRIENIKRKIKAVEEELKRRKNRLEN